MASGADRRGSETHLHDSSTWWAERCPPAPPGKRIRRVEIRGFFSANVLRDLENYCLTGRLEPERRCAPELEPRAQLTGLVNQRDVGVCVAVHVCNCQRLRFG